MSNPIETIRDHLSMFVLDVLRWADSYDSILNVINDHSTVGWRDVWGRRFSPMGSNPTDALFRKGLTRFSPRYAAAEYEDARRLRHRKRFMDAVLPEGLPRSSLTATFELWQSSNAQKPISARAAFFVVCRCESSSTTTLTESRYAQVPETTDQ